MCAPEIGAIAATHPREPLAGQHDLGFEVADELDRIGILMLVVLGSLGLENIHAMNGLKNFFGLCINGVASAIFIFSGRVDGPAALVMLVGAVLGGFAGARLGRYIGQAGACGAVVVIGVVLAVLLCWQQG